MRLMTVFRGDRRDENALRASGGFVPQYLLNTHAGGLNGFIACPNRVNGKLGCTCAGFTEADLITRARQKLTDVLTTNPMTFQQHVMFNNVGFLSTAVAHDDAYGGHQYRIFVEFQLECTVAQAGAVLGLNVQRRNAIADRFRILMDSNRISNATIIGVIPHQAVELSFISPVPFRYMAYDGFVA